MTVFPSDYIHALFQKAGYRSGLEEAADGGVMVIEYGTATVSGIKIVVDVSGAQIDERINWLLDASGGDPEIDHAKSGIRNDDI